MIQLKMLITGKALEGDGVGWSSGIRQAVRRTDARLGD